MVQSCYVFCCGDRMGSHINYTKFLSQHCGQCRKSFHPDLTMCSQKPMLILLIPLQSYLKKKYSPKLLQEFATLSGVGFIAIGGVTNIILWTNHNQSNIECQDSHLGQFYPKAQLVLSIQWDGKSRRTVKTGSFLQLIHQGKEVKMMEGSRVGGECVLLMMLHKMQ